MSKAAEHIETAPAYRQPSDSTQRIYSPQTIAVIVAELAAQQIPAAAALEMTGLAETQLASHKTQISYQQVLQVVRNALRLSLDPAIALRAGQRIRVTSYGMYGYALLSSATYADARAFANRYNRVIGPLCDIANIHRDGMVRCTLQPVHWPNPADELHRFAVEFSSAVNLSVIRDLVDPAFSFSRVTLAYPAPAHAAIYESVLACPLAFAQSENAFEYDLAQADGPIALADARTHAMAREVCEQLLADVNRAGGMAADIRRALIENPGHYPTLEAMAQALKIHPRALRRKLKMEQTSYRDLLAEMRARLAIEYLRKTDMTNEEIANRLGYSDAANFRHAFSRWTGKSPSDFRAAAST